MSNSTELKTPALHIVDEVLAWHEGDPRAAIESLLRDREFLREQLNLANRCVSRGLTRGWLPEAEPSAFVAVGCLASKP